MPPAAPSIVATHGPGGAPAAHSIGTLLAPVSVLRALGAQMAGSTSCIPRTGVHISSYVVFNDAPQAISTKTTCCFNYILPVETTDAHPCMCTHSVGAGWETVQGRPCGPQNQLDLFRPNRPVQDRHTGMDSEYHRPAPLRHAGPPRPPSSPLRSARLSCPLSCPVLSSALSSALGSHGCCPLAQQPLPAAAAATYMLRALRARPVVLLPSPPAAEQSAVPGGLAGQHEEGVCDGKEHARPPWRNRLPSTHPEPRINVPAWVFCMSSHADLEFRAARRTLPPTSVLSSPATTP